MGVRAGFWAVCVSVGACFGCDGFGQSSSEAKDLTVPQPGPEEALGWKYVSASKGGIVQVPDGAWLEVPPGALSHDTRIVIRIPNPPSGSFRTYQLEPAGTKFAKPVTLHIPYADHPSGREPVFTVLQGSETNPTVSATSELTNWQWADVVARDEDANVLSVGLSHFSFVFAINGVDDDAYLVLDLPWKYLHPGDVLVTLTTLALSDGPDWRPGHVGILSKVEGGKLAQSSMIEATPDTVRQSPVHKINNLSNDGHLYLGARQPPGPPLALTERQLMLGFLQQQLGKKYSVVGSGLFDEDTWSCVGLAEGAYDFIDRGVLSGWRQATAAAPRELFAGTRPVTAIAERPEQPIQIPIYGVVVDPGSAIVMRSLRGHYQRTKLYTVAMPDSGKPEGATLTGDAATGYVFSWTPTLEQACDTTPGKPPCTPYAIPFELTAYPDGLLTPWFGGPVKITETLFVDVTGASRAFDLNPVQPLGTHQTTVSIQLPDDAIVKRTVFRDEATLAAPSMTPFTDHVMTVKYDGVNPQSPNVVNLVLEIKNTSNKVVAEPTKKLRYIVDYVHDHWRNDG